MKKIISIKSFLIILVATFISGCGPKVSSITYEEMYPSFYKDHPVSILVLPAKNTTTSVDAAEHFRYTIARPLSERGFYIFPVHLVSAFLRSENIQDIEMIRQIPVEKLREIFGADAILYIDINAWDTGYTFVTSNVDVGLSFSLVNAKTGEEIWQNNSYAYSYDGLDFSSIGALVVSAITTAVNTSTDYNKLAMVANNASVVFMPFGKYNPNYHKEMNIAMKYLDKSKIRDGKLYVNKYFIYGNESKEKVPLVVRGHLKGYHAIGTFNPDIFEHNGYSNYYITEKVGDKVYLKNMFFRYDNHRPYLLTQNVKAFIVTDTEGRVHHSEDNDGFYFDIERIQELKNTKKED